jgi:hypothetical protein
MMDHTRNTIHVLAYRKRKHSLPLTPGWQKRARLFARQNRDARPGLVARRFAIAELRG